MSLNHEFVSTGFLNFKLIFWQITKMIICRYSEEVWSVLVGSIVWYRVSRDNQLYAELCSPRGCSIVSNYYHKLRTLVGGDSFRELELGKWVTITITFLNFFSPFTRNMPGQANAIVQRLKTDTHVRYQDDWKVITFFIGGNDLCDYCHDQVTNAFILD